MTQRRDASALLTGCHEPWRRQRPNHDLLTRPDWHRLLPLVAQVQTQRPDVALPAVLTDRVASARSLPGVLAWRLWRLLRASRQSDIFLQNLTPRTDCPRDEDTTDSQEPRQTGRQTSQSRSTATWQEHLSAVRALGGPVAVRAALAAASERSNGRTGARERPNSTTRTLPRRHFPR